jgi:hypothetical protein
MEAGAGPGDGAPGKNNLEETSGDKAPKSDEESKGLLSTLFKQGRNLFTSPQRGEGAGATSAEGIEEADLTEATREYLAKAATKFIERAIQLGFKGVDDFDESKGATFGDQMIEVLERSLMARLAGEKQIDEAEAHIQIAEEAVKLAEAERAAFGGASHAAGAGRSSAMLRQTLGADGRYCIVADIVDALKDAPIRTGANAVLDQELKDTLSVVADIARGDLSWAAEARLSLKGMQAVEMDSFVTHIVRVGESLEKQGEVTATKMEDFGHFFKLGHTILTDKSVPCARPALIEAFRNAEEQDGNVKVFYDVYTAAANRSKEGIGVKEVREAVTAIQDDVKILKKMLYILITKIKVQTNMEIYYMHYWRY